MTQENGSWVRRRTAVLLTAALAASPVLSAPLTALADDGQPAAATSAEQPETGATTTTGVAAVNGQSYDTLEAAIAAASAGQAVTLEQDVELAAPIDLPAGVTLDGSGHALTCTAEVANGALVSVTNDDVTVKNLTVNTEGLVKHGIQFYCVTGGVVESCTVNGGRYTSICVNGSEVTIRDTTLNPDASAYASVEYGMGSGVTKVPSVTLENVTSKSSTAPLVYADSSTMERVAENSDPKIDPSDTAAIVGKINSTLTGAQVSLDENGGATTGKPEDPAPDPDPDPNPPAQTGEPVSVEPSAGGTVKVSATRAEAGDTVTITLEPNEGQKVDAVAVTDAEGNKVEVKPGAQENEYTFVMPDSAVTVSATFACDGGESCPTHGYPDVDQSAWYHSAVDWATENGIMTGYGNGTGDFGPTNPVERAQMAVVLWRLAGEPKADVSSLPSDCDKDAWYAEAVAWVLESGIFHGYNSEAFGPADNLTREQAVTVLMNAAKVAGEDVSQRADLSAFPDEASVAPYAREAMEWAVATGVISGTGSEPGARLLSPQGTCTRAELAAILMRNSNSG